MAVLHRNGVVVRERIPLGFEQGGDLAHTLADFQSEASHRGTYEVLGTVNMLSLREG